MFWGVFPGHSPNQSSFFCVLSLHFFLKFHIFLLLFITQNYPAPPLASFTSFLGLFLHFLLLPFQSQVCFQCAFCCVQRKAMQQNIFSILAWVLTSPLVIICSQIPKDILLWTSAVAKKTKDTWKKFWGDLPIAEICDKPFLQSLNWAENNRKVDLGTLETQHWGQIQLAKWKPMVICKPSCPADPSFTRIFCPYPL